MRAGSPSDRGWGSLLSLMISLSRYSSVVGVKYERRRCALSYISFMPCVLFASWLYRQNSETFIALTSLRMSSFVDCFLSVRFRHSELMGRESRSRASRTVGQAKAPLVTLVLPLTNRTMPSFSSKDEK